MFINRMFILGVLMVSGITATTTVVSAQSLQEQPQAAALVDQQLVNDYDIEAMERDMRSSVADGAEEAVDEGFGIDRGYVDTMLP